MFFFVLNKSMFSEIIVQVCKTAKTFSSPFYMHNKIIKKSPTVMIGALIVTKSLIMILMMPAAFYS
jgi:hypothetical protein